MQDHPQNIRHQIYRQTYLKGGGLVVWFVLGFFVNPLLLILIDTELSTLFLGTVGII